MFIFNDGHHFGGFSDPDFIDSSHRRSHVFRSSSQIVAQIESDFGEDSICGLRYKHFNSLQYQTNDHNDSIGCFSDGRSDDIHRNAN